ncbi:hypothetical protein MTR67_038517 [Solanum verrucosum]|uniref:Uncharacterized protein n=1 Tax=Solanum verrucosum TaxID=315347 RepID=A0AAF0UFM7_SOLVR|nr:hypothetical protein MTR67_038517 [Solanum verrucosum]
MYSGSSTGASLIHPRVRVSYVSQDEDSLGDQQWSSSVGHVQGVGSDRDSMCIYLRSLIKSLFKPLILLRYPSSSYQYFANFFSVSIAIFF